MLPEGFIFVSQSGVKYSKGKFGFSVQKKIYVETGNLLDGQYHVGNWEEFCNLVGWRKDGNYVDYYNLKANPYLSPAGEFPKVGYMWQVRDVRGRTGWSGVVLFLRANNCKL